MARPYDFLVAVERQSRAMMDRPSRVGGGDRERERKRESMWQIICLCLPAITMSERQRFFSLFSKTLHASGREPGEMDIGLFFLHSLSSGEALTVLEERRDLVVRSQELMQQPHPLRGLPEKGSAAHVIEMVIDDHIQTLLAAEHAWLERTIAQLQTLSENSWRGRVPQNQGTHLSKRWVDE